MSDNINWTVDSYKDRVWLESKACGLIPEVILRVDADFIDFDTKWDYAQKLADKLNGC